MGLFWGKRRCAQDGEEMRVSWVWGWRCQVVWRENHPPPSLPLEGGGAKAQLALEGDVARGRRSRTQRNAGCIGAFVDGTQWRAAAPHHDVDATITRLPNEPGMRAQFPPEQVRLRSVSLDVQVNVAAPRGGVHPRAEKPNARTITERRHRFVLQDPALPLHQSHGLPICPTNSTRKLVHSQACDGVAGWDFLKSATIHLDVYTVMTSWGQKQRSQRDASSIG
jgi:hypothetical protein